ncbi:hypothetical protein DINM_021156 [Dirofilaria immitis]|nr:hypothetical protein [Dirofilaria immitis]
MSAAERKSIGVGEMMSYFNSVVQYGELLIAVLMVSLYTSGLLSVAYMLIMISKFDKELEHYTTTKIAITDAKQLKPMNSVKKILDIGLKLHAWSYDVLVRNRINEVIEE